MSITEEGVILETPEPQAVPEEPEKVHEYQPTDELGRPLGGKQVIKYRTIDELTHKLTEQNVLLVRKLRETTKKNRLGIRDVETIPEDAQLFDAPIEFTPRQLTAEDRVQLSRDMLDPERFDSATDALFEAKLGVKPDVLRKTLTDVQATNLTLQAKIEADAFLSDTPEYFKCRENFETITNWMLKNNLAPVRNNFKHAYQTLNNEGLLVRGPVVPVEPVVAPVVPPVPVEPAAGPVTAPVQEPPKTAVSRVATGLTRDSAGDSTGVTKSVGDDIVYEVVKGGVVTRYTGLKAIDMMPSDEFRKRIIKDKTFNQKYEQLLEEQKQKRNVRG